MTNHYHLLIETVDPNGTLDFLYVDRILAQFFAQTNEAIRLYRKFVNNGITDSKTPWAKLTGRFILGSASFVKNTGSLIADKRELKEIPRCQRYPGWPLLQELFAQGDLDNKAKRNEILRNAYSLYGYTLKEIADHIGVHYSTVSRIVNSK